MLLENVGAILWISYAGIVILAALIVWLRGSK